jgi:hypothetical protein
VTIAANPYANVPPLDVRMANALAAHGPMRPTELAELIGHHRGAVAVCARRRSESFVVKDHGVIALRR